jgi:hypothetical protein
MIKEEAFVGSLVRIFIRARHCHEHLRRLTDLRARSYGETVDTPVCWRALTDKLEDFPTD